ASDGVSRDKIISTLINNEINLKDCLGSGYLSNRLSQRKVRLQQGCSSLDTNNFERSREWTRYSPSKTERFYHLDAAHKASVCVIPKAGSKAWVAQKAAMMDNNIKAADHIKVLPVRHPFARLVSVF
ncbi:unnamed protein product, partial [Meganyctiphanes norvegica]